MLSSSSQDRHKLAVGCGLRSTRSNLNLTQLNLENIRDYWLAVVSLIVIYSSRILYGKRQGRKENENGEEGFFLFTRSQRLERCEVFSSLLNYCPILFFSVLVLISWCVWEWQSITYNLLPVLLYLLRLPLVLAQFSCDCTVEQSYWGLLAGMMSRPCFCWWASTRVAVFLGEKRGKADVYFFS